jgi:hypothetical protein
MISKALPYLLILLPIIGFFFTPEPSGSVNSDGKQAIADGAYFLFTIPWQGKAISIIIGAIWLLLRSNKDEEN